MAESINPDGPKKLFSSLKDVHPKISVFWAGGLILVMLFFWRAVGPGSPILCFCCMPVFFIIIVVVLGIGNGINTARNGIKLILLWRKYEPLHLNRRYVMLSALINILGWVAVILTPIHWTWEGWYLDQHWNEYNTVVEESYIKNLERPYGQGESIGRKLPRKYETLSLDGTVRYEYGQSLFVFYSGNDRYGILYCPDAKNDCDVKAGIYMQDHHPICWSLKPYWYRCAIILW
ncbi:MAG: hypothetical protein BroJett018_30430 [Chloroflexota bacterium]|nr:hypothetical protein [Chloroflexota bacterium]NOG65058.1 hypothetical protein [Chloroflexota bacterium]GIK65249.1 MAG: hypothetical protein BroJett018_30430 [Chloroflexota bacterium]